MDPHRKDVTDLVPSDAEISPVWEYDLANEADSETAVIPVLGLPVATLDNRVLLTSVRFANGQIMPAMITNLDATNALVTRHFLNLAIYKDGWFYLARYHDFGHAESSAPALAEFLDLDVKDIFPISYDVRAHCTGDPLALTGAVEAEPRERLSQDQLMDLVIRKKLATTILERTLELPHAVVFVADPTIDWDVPPDTSAASVTTTPTCAAILATHYQDGPTTLRLGSAFDNPAGEIIFEGEIETPGRKVEVSDSHQNTILLMDVPNPVTKLTVWTNRATEPDLIHIRAR